MASRWTVPALKTRSLPDVIGDIELVEQYFAVMLSILRLPNLAYDREVASIFGLRPALGYDRSTLPNQVAVDRNSYLGRGYRNLSEYTQRDLGSMTTGEASLLFTSSSLDRLIRRVLQDDLAVSLDRLHKALASLKVLRPCPEASVGKRCKREPCDQDHRAVLLQDYPVLAIRTNLAAINALNKAWELPGGTALDRFGKLRRQFSLTWVDRLFRAVYTFPANITCATTYRGFPESHGISTVKIWIRDLILGSVSDGVNPHHVLTNSLIWIIMSYSLHDGATPGYFQTATSFFAPRPELERAGNPINTTMEDIHVSLSRDGGEDRLSRGVMAAKYV